jgi:hypothetical protein
VEIASSWQDHCDIETDNDHVQYDLAESTNQNVLSIGLRAASALNNPLGTSGPDLKVTIPEMFGLEIVANDACELHLSLRNKMQGDAYISFVRGSLEIDKLRGESLSIKAKSAPVLIRKLIEGGIDMECSSLDAKMVNGDDINIKSAGSISIGALYCKRSNLSTTKGPAKLGVTTGAIELATKAGSIHVGGVDGSLTALAIGGDVVAQFNKLNPDVLSSLRANGGSVRAGINPAIPVRISGTAGQMGKAGSHFSDEGNGSKASTVYIKSEAFEGNISENGQSAVGFLPGEDSRKSGPTFKKSASAIGKINLEAAAEQSLGSSVMSTSRSGHPGGSSASDDSSWTGASIDMNATGDVEVETLSWIDVIRRKHGLEGASNFASRPRPGRTAATRHGKAWNDMMDPSKRG